MNEEFPKAYNSKKTEDRIYKMWEDSGYFNPDNLPDTNNKEVFSMALPPPNVTGVLHIGHVFEDSIQDTITRYQRMKGKKTLWIAGTDHAAIATQAKFEKDLQKKENKSRHDFSRNDFFQMIQEFAKQNQTNILNQLKKIGVSIDWSRLAFTLDEKRSLAVKTAFKKMFDAELIYRGYKVINWDVKGQTTVSDDEVEHEERKAILYTFRYSKDFPIPIATSRPETKVGDTAVAVNPKDERYKEYIGKEYELNFAGVPLKIKIVGDESAEMEFGTGALGVTPAHSMTDWEIAQKHNLPIKEVINEFGKMKIEGDLNGKKTTDAREMIVQWLRENNLLEKEEEIIQNVSIAQRTGGVIEPLPKLQWFVDVNKKFVLENSKITGISSGSQTTLKEIMNLSVKNNQIKILPDRFEKNYYYWIENLRDWCISRQIIYGHRIPVYYCSDESNKESQKFSAEIENPTKCPFCGKCEMIEDQDTLDTWFSSGLWTFSTLGWPNLDSKDLKEFHPTSIVIPGYEILFFWVARMILMSGFLLGNIPFSTVYLHGMVRDSKGQKFSKSAGNGIDPLEIIDTYGTDALRMALIVGVAPGNDSNFDSQKVKGYKHFANKLWNIARFIQINTADFSAEITKPEAKTDADKNILNKLDEMVSKISTELDTYQLHEAGLDIYHFIWHEFADVYIEASKAQLGSISSPEKADDAELSKNTKAILHYSLLVILKLLHPFMPFVTEEIYQQMFSKNKKDLLMIQKWPNLD